MGKQETTPTVFEARIVGDENGYAQFEVIDAETGTAILTTSDKSEAIEFCELACEVNGHDIFYGERARRYTK